MSAAAPADPWSVLDWRRRTARLYAGVRLLAHDDPAAAHGTWARGRTDLLATHSASPVPAEARDAVADLWPVAPYDPELRFDVAIDPEGAGERWTYPTGTDGDVAFVRVGTAPTPLGPLAVWWLAAYGGGIFVPVADPHPSTFGGGRYVVDTVKGADLGSSLGTDGAGRLVLDLNFAYSPSCAYDPEWACPLAPAANRLDVPIGVGELVAAPSQA
ncbi:protein of unknown function DUF1684 [Beutenbergia cavernae DSM 12333]|uniref:DUF1684 domain-containing protein n=1 Tax=Beutenbergia cavernae (strain ATCC BAA-8 / DSM 12333 / CCUG 43141 / JCM 11478 / NBRC 16432 / NCIMB 13614 / HKI 0122) TaxID=471853 RepID=C5BYL2_BEUC1|nr:DUF1684 domain-containing protein [Beutenbergia cavernae]ACQ78970.1 protein of unknown function DUF1684 [Beutenbergia cavernae DSM 12333]